MPYALARIPHKSKGRHIVVGGRGLRETLDGLQEVEAQAVCATSGRVLKGVLRPLQPKFLTVTLRFDDSA